MYYEKIPKYYRTAEELNQFIQTLPLLRCPFCYSTGTFILHGFLTGYGNDGIKGSLIRGRRIYCSTRNHHNGCGHTLSIISAKHIYRFCINALNVWLFFKNVYSAKMSKRAAFKALNLNMSESMPYHLIRRLRQALSNIRSTLFRHNFGIDPPDTTSNPLEALINHLNSISCDTCTISFYQHLTQKSFL